MSRRRFKGEDMPDSITVATYNALAAMHVRPKYYPKIDPKIFDPRTRYPHVVERVLGLDADVVCLQEVDEDLMGKLRNALEPLNYRGTYSAKMGKKEGLAIFAKWPLWSTFRIHLLHYRDAHLRKGVSSGHLAQILKLQLGHRSLYVANTHLKWDAPDTEDASRVGLAQANQLATALPPSSELCIVCGDFNAGPSSDTMEEFHNVGYLDTYGSSQKTFNPNGRPKKIDYLLHSEKFLPKLLPLPKIDASTLLPSETEPSDHIPLIARFTLV